MYIYIFFKIYRVNVNRFSLCMDGLVMCDRPIRSHVTWLMTLARIIGREDAIWKWGKNARPEITVIIDSSWFFDSGGLLRINFGTLNFKKLRNCHSFCIVSHAFLHINLLYWSMCVELFTSIYIENYILFRYTLKDVLIAVITGSCFKRVSLWI